MPVWLERSLGARAGKWQGPCSLSTRDLCADGLPLLTTDVQIQRWAVTITAHTTGRSGFQRKETICCPQSPSIIPPSLSWMTKDGAILYWSFVFLLFFVHALWLVKSYFPDQELNLGPQQGKQSPYHWTTREFLTMGTFESNHIYRNLESHCTCPIKDIVSERTWEDLKIVPQADTQHRDTLQQLFYFYFMYLF